MAWANRPCCASSPVKTTSTSEPRVSTAPCCTCASSWPPRIRPCANCCAACCRHRCDVPDNFLDLGGKRWLERRMIESSKTILFVSHDRELLSRTAHKLVTIESDGAWVHTGT